MNVEFSKEFQKSVSKQSGKTLNSVRRVVQEVIDADTVEQLHDCKKLVGFEHMYRIRIGGYRAFFSLHIQIFNHTVFFQYFISRGQAYDLKMLQMLKNRDR